MNVAMAFTSRTAMPKFILDERTGQRFQVWDGDNYDARFLDPKPGQPGNELNQGMIVGLTNKDKTTKPEDAAVKHNGFFLDYDPDRDGDTLVIKTQKALAGGGKKTIPIAAKPANDGEAKITASRQRTPLGFYSALADGVDGIKTNAAPAAGWKDAIKGLVNKGAVKADEVEWSGVNDWLDLQTGRVTKEQVAEYLKQGGVRVEEVVNSAQADNREDKFLDKWAPEAESIGMNIGFLGNGKLVFTEEDYTADDVLSSDWATNAERDLVMRMEQDWTAGRSAGSITKYDLYTLPGGSNNYREVLLTLPTAVDAKTKRLMDEERYLVLSSEQQAEVDAAKRKSGVQYRSSHWDQPNVLAHIRVNDRTDADGKKVLFVEELQSDWGQEGKKKGFKRSDAEMVAAGKRMAEDHAAYIKEESNALNEELRSVKARLRQIPAGETADAAAPLRAREESIYRQLRILAESEPGKPKNDGAPTAPFVTKTEGWLNLALKRVITMAVEGGYDRVAFVNGEQSADRYNLSKTIKYVQWDTGYDENRRLITLETTDGKALGITVQDGVVEDSSIGADGKPLDEVLGKELAGRITSQRSGDLRGLQLKMGGEGMKTFYDTIVPTALKKLLPKVGGGQIANVLLDNQSPVIQVDDNAWAVREDDSGRAYRTEQEAIAAATSGSTQPGFDVTDAMREKVAEGLPLFSRQRDTGWRDETGRAQFAPGAVAYRYAADVANAVLDKVGLKPISTELGRAMRKMKVEVERAQNLTVDVAEKLKTLSEDERQMISDVIEGELKAGVTPPKKILDLAASMQTIMSEQSAELVRLGMLSPEAAGRWEGKYLPRFYETKLTGEVKGWARAALELVRKPRTMQGIKGSNLKSRGIFKTIPVDELDQWTAEGWEQRDPGFNPAKDRETQVWRDFTREEREEMGEIRDAMFRFVMGYNATQRDVALGRMYERIAQDVASRTEKEGFVQVPDTKVTDTQARRYGALAGMYVPKEVMDHLSAYDGTMQNEIVKMYLSALAKWKEGKTVLNPVSHANNILSNLTMAHFAGVSYWDAGKYAGAVRDLMRNDPMVKEAQEAGLFLGTFSRADLLKDMPDQLKMLAGASEGKIAKAGNTVWNALSFFLNKPLGKAYDAEDQFFRYLIYRDARKRGLESDDAVEYAQKFIFTYDDLPKTARIIRDTALPFFSYTYKVVPALASTALEKPWRFAAPAGVLYGVNALFYAMAQAADEGEDDDWLEAARRYITDPAFRARAKGLEESERANLPEWMKGMSATLGTPKAIRLGMDDVTNLPLFLDVSKIFPGGDLLDAVNNSGGVAMLQPLTPSSPLLTTFVAMMANRDMFLGKDVTKGSDTQAELAEKRGEWLWRQFSPALAVGNYHWDRTLNAIASIAGEPVLGYTGFGKDGLPVQPGLAALQTVGIKVRPIDLEMSERIEQSDRKRLIRELDAEIRRLNQLEARGAITADNAEAQRELQREKRIRLREGLTVDGEER
jgi:hypothetical protein